MIIRNIIKTFRKFYRSSWLIICMILLTLISISHGSNTIDYDLSKYNLGINTSVVLVSDIDKDGKNEIMLGTKDKNGHVYVKILKYENNKLVDVWNYPIKLNTGKDIWSYISAITVGDVDNDGKNELIVSTGVPSDADNGDNSIRIFKMDGNINNWKEVYKYRIGELTEPNDLKVGDANNDGKNELIVGVSWYGRKLMEIKYDNGEYKVSTIDNIGSDVNSVNIKDVDNDGKNEIVLGTSCWSAYDTRVYKWDGSKYKLIWKEKTGWTNTKVSDVDLDGNNEIVDVTSQGCGCTMPFSVKIFRYCNIENTFKKIDDISIPKCYARREIDVGNLIGNKYPEIVIASGDYKNPYITILSREDSGNYVQSNIYMENNKGGRLVFSIGDVDSDGKNELLVAGTKDGLLRVYKINKISSTKNVKKTNPDSLPYWIEDLDGKYNIWTKVSIPAHGKITLIVKKGENSPNGNEVFEFFDDFDGNELDKSKWNPVGEYKCLNGEILLNPNFVGGSESGMIETRKLFGNNIEIFSKISKHTSYVRYAFGERKKVGYAYDDGGPRWWGMWVNGKKYSKGYDVENLKWSKLIITDNFAKVVDNNGFEYSVNTGIPNEKAPVFFTAWSLSNAVLDYVYVKKYADKEPIVNVKKLNDNTLEVKIYNPNDYDLNNYQIKFSGNGFVSSKYDGLVILKNNIEFESSKKEIISKPTLEISSYPKDAEIYINGKYYGKTPKEIHLDSSGDYIIRITKNNYLPFEKEIHVENGKEYLIFAALKENISIDYTKTKIDEPEKKDKSIVSINTKPENVEIYINGKYYGNTPKELTLEPKKYTLELFKEGYDITTINLDLKPGEKYNYNINLKEKEKKFDPTFGGKFLEPPTINLHLTKDELKPNEPGIIELSIRNPSINSISLAGELNIRLPSNFVVEGGDVVGGGGYYSTTFNVKPGVSKTETLYITCTNAKPGRYLVHAKVYVYPGNDKSSYQEITLTKPVNIIGENNNINENNNENELINFIKNNMVTLTVIGIILILVISFGIAIIRR